MGILSGFLWSKVFRGTQERGHVGKRKLKTLNYTTKQFTGDGVSHSAEFKLCKVTLLHSFNRRHNNLRIIYPKDANALAAPQGAFCVFLNRSRFKYSNLHLKGLKQ